VVANSNNTVREILKRDNNGQISLYKIAKSGDNEFVRLLLDYKTKKEPRDYKKRIVFYLIASNGNLDTIILFLESENNIRNKYG
jgi:ankyrin repeat protein